MSEPTPITQTNGASENKPSEETVVSTPSGFVFGSNSTLSGGGFGAFTGGQQATAKGVSEEQEEGDGDEAHPGEEDCSPEYTPVVQLDEVETTTGEEEETAIFESKSKLYRFDNAGNEWKERGIGIAKLLKHKENGRIRFLLREEKTLKIRSNHMVMPSTKLQNHAGNERAIVWSAVDFADEEQKIEMFCLRFGSEEKASLFRQSYEESMAVNEKLIPVGEESAEKATDSSKEVAEELAKETEKAVNLQEK